MSEPIAPDDLGAGQEAADSTRPDVRYLKILSGPQRGAEAKLPEGSYRLGSEDDCDLVLSDASVEPRHAQVVLSDGQIHLEAEDGDVNVDGTLLEAGRSTELPGTAVIGIGTTVVAIGPDGTDWASLELPPEPVRPEPDDPETDDLDLDDDSDVIGLDDGDGLDVQGLAEDDDLEADGVGGDLAASTSGDESAEAEPKPKRLRMSVVLPAVMIVAAAAIAIFAVVESRTVPVDETAERAAAAQRNLVQAKTAVAATNVDGLELTLARDGTVVVQGYTETASQKAAVAEALSASGVDADNRIWVVATMMQEVRSALDRLGAGTLEAEHLGEGAVALSGYYTGNLSTEELAASIRDEVPSVRSIRSQEQTLAQAVEDLRGRLRRVNLADSLTVNTDGFRIAVSGVLDPDQMDVWNTVRGDFETETDGQPTIESLVRAQQIRGTQIQEVEKNPEAAPVTTDEAPTFPDLKIAGVFGYSGDSLRALLEDGTTVAVGDVIDGEYVVETIAHDEVVLSKKGQRRTYKVGRHE